MKKIIFVIAIFVANSLSSQVVIGGKDSITNSSVSLELSDGKNGNKGLILPWVISASNVSNAVDGTMIFDVSDKKVKYSKSGTWVDLTIDSTGKVDTSLQDTLVDKREAKIIITSNNSIIEDTTDGILILADNNKAMILPKVPNPHLNIINPAAGMIVYDIVARQLAVFNGSVWSFWKP